MTWLVIAGMTVITFFNRYAFFTPALRYQPTAKVRLFLSYSSYAVLTAIWAPILFRVELGEHASYAGLDYLVAAILAALMSFLRVPSIAVLVISTLVFFGLRFLLTSALS